MISRFLLKRLFGAERQVILGQKAIFLFKAKRNFENLGIELRIKEQKGGIVFTETVGQVDDRGADEHDFDATQAFPMIIDFLLKYLGAY